MVKFLPELPRLKKQVAVLSSLKIQLYGDKHFAYPHHLAPFGPKG
jgi:hypothetical protein